MNIKLYLKKILDELPNSPGVYLMKDIFSEIIYVGKAKSLKKRVKQYFSNSIKDNKVLAMVKNIDDIEYILTKNEMEALILENNLIKQNKPFYNILLRDDKTFPYVKITDEEYPRIFKTRNKYDKKGNFFGPYTDVKVLNSYLKEIIEIFGIRDCSRNIEKSILNKDRPCLNYYIGICKAPCAKKISKEEYNDNINTIKNLLSGDHRVIKEKFVEKMNAASKELRFEDAAYYRDLINNLSRMNEIQNISINKISKEQHYISFYKDDNTVVFTIFIYEKGNLVKEEHFDFDIIGLEEEEISTFIIQYYMDSERIPTELYVDFDLDVEIIEKVIESYTKKSFKILRPKIGRKKEILDLAKSNSKERFKILDIKRNKKNNYSMEINKELKAIINISDINTIEAYDISNINGKDSVGVKVTFENFKKKPSGYRKYNINTINDIDDYASMREVIERRIKRGEFPDLILLDGGKGHVSTIKKLFNENNVKINVFGIYKNDKHKTEGLCDEENLYYVDKKTKLFKFLSEIQEEVHRFAINFHRHKREISMIKSELDNIKGVGEKRRNDLLKKFKNIENIKRATYDELLEVKSINHVIAKDIVDYFKYKK